VRHKPRRLRRHARPQCFGIHLVLSITGKWSLQ
jgi:hypothetical protein